MSHNWDVLDNPDVIEIVEQASSTVSYNLNIDVDDAMQESYLLVCDTTGSLFEKAWIGGPMLGLLQYELERDLMNKFETEVRRRNKATSLEKRNEAIEGDEAAAVVKVHPARPYGVAYDQTLIELLLPAVWDEQYCYGMQQENAADPDMPRGSTNKATGNTLAAHLADIRSAWQRASLTTAERQVLLLAYGADMPQRLIAFYLGYSQQWVSTLAASGVASISRYLNGTNDTKD